MNALLYVAGLLTWPTLMLLWWLGKVTRVALHDTYWLAKTGTLKDGYSRLRWLLIVPREFARSWRKTAWDSMRGMERVL